ncbi:AEC family transporter [Pseudodesulfovibrio sp.]|uniref:AEC family transporter n=1 Tax=unclassified Pseudodesulfovibrio TaxID=2661612 RepID=UPI003AFFE59C
MFDSFFLILPIFIILGFGVALDIANILPKQTGSVIGSYVLYAALPILLIHIMAKSSMADILHGGFWAGMLLTQAIIYAAVYAGEFFLGKRGHGPATSIAMSSSCCNVAFIGLPVVLSLMPNNHVALVAAGLSTLTPNVVSIPCQIEMEFLKHKGESGNAMAQLAKAVLLNPLMVGTIVGLALGLTGIGLWGPLDKAAEMVGNTTAPCMLLALGLDLRDKLRVALTGNWRARMPRIGIITVVKLAINPILAWFLLSLFGVSGTWLAVGVIQSGTATALISYVIAEIYGFVSEEVAMIAVVTNVLNLLTLAVITAILRSQGLM